MDIDKSLEGALQRHFKKNKGKGVLYEISHDSYYLPVEFTWGRAAIFHGYSGHSDQPAIRNFVRMLKRDMHFTAFTCDFPYHGLSNDPEKPEDLGKITSFRRWVHTVRLATYQTLKLRSDPKKNPGTFLVGESGGALGIVRFLEVNPEIQKYLAGVVIAAIPLEVDQNASQWVQRNKRKLEPVFSFLALFFPNLPVGDLPDGDREDPMEYHGRVRARTAKEIRNAAFEARARKAMEKITVPVLFIHSDSDTIAPLEPVKVAYRSIATHLDKKEFIVYSGAPHKVLQQSLEDVRQWMEKRNATKDWVPFQEEGVLNETVKLSAAWLYAIQKTLLFIPTIRPLLRKNLTAAWQKIVHRN